MPSTVLGADKYATGTKVCPEAVAGEPAARARSGAYGAPHTLKTWSSTSFRTYKHSITLAVGRYYRYPCPEVVEIHRNSPKSIKIPYVSPI